MSKYTDSCTSSDALQTLSSQYAQSNARVRSGVERQIDRLLPSASTGDQLAVEFLAQKAHRAVAPTTFNARALVAAAKPTSRAAGRWADEFAGSQQATVGDRWSREFAAQSRFDGHTQMPTATAAAWAEEMTMTRSGARPEEWARDFDAWLGGGGGQTTAAKPTLDAAWDETRDVASSSGVDTLGDQWANELASGLHINDQSPDDLLEAEFDSLYRSGLDRFSDQVPLDELSSNYVFDQTNPHLNDQNLMERAADAMDSGQTQKAILYYEAAVQRDPRDATAWCKLGLSHAEHENDVAAISAFLKCLEIAPSMRDALIGYSVSLANESYDNEALAQLEKWIHGYTNGEGVSHGVQPTSVSMLNQSYIDASHFARVEARFLDAARQQANGVDSELQNALGVLYNLNRNFDRAVDSIKAAIARSPDNPRLWNRLGATLANGDRTAEAIESYRHALTLFPAYVRARYNLGISCMHLNCHREASEHFISALRLQNSSEASPIWSTLRSAIIRMNATDVRLMEAIDSRDVGRVASALSSAAVS